MSKFRFDQIHLLQSLPEGELNVARILKEEILRAQPDATDRVHLREFDDAPGLLLHLAAIASEAESGRGLPFIHFECHGNDCGLILASGELVRWAELADVLRPINIAARLNLFVSLAACNGQNLATCISPVQPTPVWGLIGPLGEQTVGFLFDFFKRFFTSLLSNPSLERAIAVGCGSSPKESCPMALWPAEYFFCYVFSEYERISRKNVEIARTAKRLAARVQQEVGLPKADRLIIARKMRRDLKDLDPEILFAKYRRIFLMLEEFPENDERFTRTWTDFEREYWQERS